MFHSRSLAACFLALASSALAATIPNFAARDTSCSNGPTSRQCWSDGYSVATDYDQKWPTTGKTVSYDFEVTQQTMSPDGFARPMLVFNGQYPGPTIEANWGDTISVTITNSIPGNNGTSIHWHGFHQRGTNEMDGTAGITECPIVPGGSRTYTFVATTHGTSWYHAHLSLQYGDGLVGPIIIHGPATANYDIDLGVLPMTDWFHTPGFVSLPDILVAQAPPVASSILVNGTANVAGAGKYANTVLTPGKKHRLRLLSTAINQYLQVSLDSHPFTVISSDFTPIVPFTTNTLSLAPGQRYDVIITANATVGNYWFHVGTGSGATSPADRTICDGPNLAAQAGKSIFSYKNATAGNPISNSTTTPFTYGKCFDQPYSQIVPYVKTTVPQGMAKEFDVAFQAAANGTTVLWKINGSSLEISWDKPTLQNVIDGTTNDYPVDDNVYHIDNEGSWTFWIIQQDVSGAVIPPLAHPIHLHGHDFWILGAGQGKFAGSGLNYDNPPRRDTVTLPPAGWVVIAFPANNPGAWVLHCHIPFHMSQGFGLQFVEAPAKILSQDLSVFKDGCSAFNSHTPKIIKPDSGL